MRSQVHYSGGKGASGVYQSIINLMPPHSTYIEAFLGMGSILRHKRPAERNIGIDVDPKVIARWKGDEVPGLEILCTDAITFLSEFPLSGGELIYCDPPYLPETRTSRRNIYRHEFTEDQHKRLLELVNRLSCMVMISGYWSTLYANELASWCTFTYQTVKRNGNLASEWVWLNFPPPVQLHDYQYLGGTFRDRERIKRKSQRWKDRLLRMPMLERQAIFAAINELYQDDLSNK